MSNNSQNTVVTKGNSARFFAGFFVALIGIIIFIIVQNLLDTHSYSASVASETGNTQSVSLSSAFGYFSLLMLIMFVMFFLVRSVALWYWKIDKIVHLLEKIEENTRKETIQEAKLADAVPSIPVNENSARKSLKEILNTKIF